MKYVTPLQTVLALLMALASLIACGGAGARPGLTAHDSAPVLEESLPASEIASAGDDRSMGHVPVTAPRGAKTDAPEATSAGGAASPRLVYTAALRIAAFETDTVLDAMVAHANEAGGYLVRRTGREAVVRVPAARFQSTLTTFGDLGDVLHRDVHAQDVTDEFVDLQTRLRNARAIRDRLEQLLERAATVEDALRVERELGRVTGEVERLEGRLKRLGELTAFATITAHVEPRPVEAVDSDPFTLPFEWLDDLGLTPLLDL